ncbi:MAG: P-II family nitrogen regulator [Planctomycetaceae bacterium]|nr:P-II family nitrogen regulator [Planctomycetaceae bacterium]
MKRIDAIIRHAKLDDVKQALTELGVTGMTVLEVRGFGRQRGHREQYRGAEYIIDYLPKLMIIVYASDELTPVIVETIVEVCGTGQMGDGKIAVYNIDELFRIRTGESGDTAL